MTGRFGLYGLVIDSDIELPALRPAPPDAVADVRVVVGDVPPINEGIARQGESIVLSIDGVARYAVTDGRAIVIAPAADADPRDIVLYLTGSVMGIVLLQRGRMALHANAVVVDGRAWLFGGPSGTGKSTLAAWFGRQGHSVLADDVAAIGWDGERPVAFAGPPRVRLWDDAIRAMGDDPARHPHSFRPDLGVAKRDVRLAEEGADAVPLGAIVLLREGTLGIVRHRGADAAAILLDNLYRGEWLAMAGGGPAIVAQAARLAPSIPVLTLSRPLGLDRIGEIVPMLDAVMAT